MNPTTKTLGDLSRETGVPLWKTRRVADGIGIDLPRAGQYRLVTPDAEQRIRAELERTGWLRPVTEAAAC